MDANENRQVRPFWLMLSLSIIIILFGIVVICAPELFWRFMDIILGFFLVLTGISAIINTVKNQKVQFIWFLLAFGILITILGFLLIFSRTQFIGTLIIWLFAIWAFLRGIILISFGALNRNNQPFWWAILGLGILLFVLGIVIMFSPKGEARALAGICIGISTVLDGVMLLFFSFKVKDNPSLQAEMLNQADQNEIAQGNVVMTETTVVISNTSTEQNGVQPVSSQEVSQPETPTPEAQTTEQISSQSTEQSNTQTEISQDQ